MIYTTLLGERSKRLAVNPGDAIPSHCAKSRSYLMTLEVRASAPWSTDLSSAGHAVLGSSACSEPIAVGIVREDHALPGFLGVDTKDRLHRHPDIGTVHREKRARKLTASLVELEIVSRRFADVEDDLAVLDVLDGHNVTPSMQRRLHDVGRVPVIAHPLMHGTNKVRSF